MPEQQQTGTRTAHRADHLQQRDIYRLRPEPEFQWRHSRTPANTSEVFVVLRNHTDDNGILEARTQFFDQSEIPTDVEPRWQRVVVPANSTSVYLEKSTTTEPLKYRVEVRQAK